jgi:hypothetical protein
LSVVLYGCKTLYLTTKENIIDGVEHRVPRRIFGSERDEITRGWRKLHN